MRAEQEERRDRVWTAFFPKLQEVRTYADTLSLLAAAPAEGSPGRKFYSNLGFFMHTFAPPMGACSAELKEYLRLIGCFDDEGALKPGVRQPVEAAMDQAIKQHPWGM
jgi:hypothetical protein